MAGRNATRVHESPGAVRTLFRRRGVAARAVRPGSLLVELLATDALIPLALGSASVFAFAPWNLGLAAPLTLACLFALWWRAGTVLRAAIQGALFGLGLFVAGTSWIHDGFARYLPDQSIVLRVLLVLLLQFASALFTAAAGLVTVLCARKSFARFCVLAPAAWTLFEWARGNLFLGGFTWLAFGYSQVPDGFASSWIPVLGVYGGSLVVAIAATALAALGTIGTEWLVGHGLAANLNAIVASGLVLVAIVVGSAALSRFDPTFEMGKPVAVAVVRHSFTGDAPSESGRAADVDTYVDAVLGATQASLVVFPEGTSRWYLDQLPASLARVRRYVAIGGRAVLLPAPAAGSGQYPRNAATLFSAGRWQRYDKIHLVPAGESLPGWMEILPGAGWNIQLWEAGERAAMPIAWQDQRLAIMICFEDAFGAELRDRLADATMLVSVSNLGWFNEMARAQHMQLSQARALEVGRPLLQAGQRDTTSIIDHRGHVAHGDSGADERVVEGQVAGRRGATPYVDWGDRPLVLGLLGLVLGVSLCRRSGARSVRHPIGRAPR